MQERRQTEAHNAIDLLEEYKSRLLRPEDQQLREAIDRVLEIFKSRLFNALLDINEFYEVTLLDDRKTPSQKTYETNRIAEKWEANPPLPNGIFPSSVEPERRSYTNVSVPDKQSELPFIDNGFRGEPVIGLAGTRGEQSRVTTGASTHIVKNYSYSAATNQLLDGAAKTAALPLAVPVTQPPYEDYSTNSTLNYYRASDTWDRDGSLRRPGEGLNGGGTHHDYSNGTDNEFEFEEIVINKGRTGLGFSIAGGRDNPHVENDPGIYVTKIIDGGGAANDGRLRPDDIILRVNDTDTVNVPHAVAVDALKRAGNTIRLYVKRYRPATPTFNKQRIELVKGPKGLGFSIAGGIGNEHLPGDTGIYITKLIDGGAAQQDGRLQVGDRLLAVGTRSLDQIAHEEAVLVLKNTSDRVVLTVLKNPYTAGAEAYSFEQPSFDSAPVPPHAFSTPGTRERDPYYQGAPEYPPPPPPVVHQDPTTVTHYPPSSELSRSARRIRLTKGAHGLGFNIVGGDNNDGIFVSHIASGGVADISGQLHKGDQLLEVNGVDLRSATHEQAATALKNTGTHVDIMAQYRPEDYRLFESKIEQLRNNMIERSGSMSQVGPRKELFVKALFDYEPSKDQGLPGRGLAFRFSDILHVTNAGDDEWWQARRVLPDGTEDGNGIIPSKKRVERKERARRKSVNFGRQASISEKHKRTGLSFSRKFPFMKSRERLNEDTDMDHPSTAYTSYTSDSDCLDESVLSYEIVEERYLNYARPVIILGAFKDKINDDLINEYPDRYGSCVPHTTRPKRPNELDGRDYHFVLSREKMELDIQNHLFVEAGQFNGNLYGTSINSIREVADEGKNCILDVSGNAIKRLQSVDMHPIAIFVKPDSMGQLKEWNRRWSDEEAEQHYNRYAMIEHDFAEYFTAIVQHCNTYEEVYNQVKDIIRQQARSPCWVHAKEQL